MTDRKSDAGSPTPALAYSYIRLSSKRQANAGDIKTYRDGYRRQVQLRDDYLAKNPHLTLDTSLDLDDIGVSAFTGANAGADSRLAKFHAAIDDGRVRPGSHLLVESLDRFTRADVLTAQIMLLSVVKKGIVVVSLSDMKHYDRSQSQADMQSSIMFSVMMLIRGHEESRVKSERLQATWANKRANLATRKLTARTPGWLELKDGKFVERPGRVQVVRMIMTLLADGFGRDNIARALNANADPEIDTAPWGHGKQWHGGTVQKVTDNRALIGEFQPCKLEFRTENGVRVGKRVPVGDPIPDYYPRVIDEDLWARARIVADKRRMKEAANAGGAQGVVITNLFGMTARCGVCGQRMNYRDRGPRSTPVLRCTGERGGACSNDYRFPYDDNENAILSWLVKVDLSGGARGEIARLDVELSDRIAKVSALKAEGERIVRRFGATNEFAEAPLREISEAKARTEREVADISGRLATLRGQGARDERTMAVSETMRLAVELRDAKDEETRFEIEAQTFRMRTKLRQIIRNTFRSMLCQPDGLIEVVTVDGALHKFRDGYWWDEKTRDWIPWAGAFFGGGYRATRKELKRRGEWLAAFAADRTRTDPDQIG